MKLRERVNTHLGTLSRQGWETGALSMGTNALMNFENRLIEPITFEKGLKDAPNHLSITVNTPVVNGIMLSYPKGKGSNPVHSIHLI